MLLFRFEEKNNSGRGMSAAVHSRVGFSDESIEQIPLHVR